MKKNKKIQNSKKLSPATLNPVGHTKTIKRYFLLLVISIGITTPWFEDYIDAKQDETLADYSKILLEPKVSKLNDPMQTYQTQILESLRNAKDKNEFIRKSKINIKPWASGVGSICAFILGIQALDDKKKKS